MILAMIFRRNPGRDLARIGIEKHRRDVRETARRIRNELLPAPQPESEAA